MGPETSKIYLRAQEDAVSLFVDSVLHNPKDFFDQTRLYVLSSFPNSQTYSSDFSTGRTAGRIIMSAIYGIPATTPVGMVRVLLQPSL